MDLVIGFITANWKEIILAATSLVTFASIIAKFTDNVWDDKLTAKLLRVLSLAPGIPITVKDKK